MIFLLLAAINPVKVGSDTYGEITLESLDVLGTAKLNKTTISKLLKITGNLVANSAHLHKVQAEGNVKLIDTKVEKEAHITGALQATNSQFTETLEFIGQRALFSKCNLHDLTIQRDLAFKARQVVELKDTIVDGSIIFEGGGGSVLLYPGSKVTGSVTGGKIIHKN